MQQIAEPKSPRACSREELREFERLVRDGFDGSDESLPERIRRAHRLVFHRSPEGELVAIAGLKAPTESYRVAVFDRAGAKSSPTDFELELGWVYVVPESRGRQAAFPRSSNDHHQRSPSWPATRACRSQSGIGNFWSSARFVDTVTVRAVAQSSPSDWRRSS